MPFDCILAHLVLQRPWQFIFFLLLLNAFFDFFVLFLLSYVSWYSLSMKQHPLFFLSLFSSFLFQRALFCIMWKVTLSLHIAPRRTFAAIWTSFLVCSSARVASSSEKPILRELHPTKFNQKSRRVNKWWSNACGILILTKNCKMSQGREKPSQKPSQKEKKREKEKRYNWYEMRHLHHKRINILLCWLNNLWIS